MELFWKNIENYENLYQINIFGEIRSKKRNTLREIHISGNGYKSITLCKNGKPKSFNIHRLLASHYINNENDKQFVNHIDGNKLNNQINNLEWVTPKENNIHAYNELKIKPSQLGRYGKNHNKSKPVIQKTLNGNFIKLWDSAMDAVRNGFDSGCITRCCQKKYKQHKGFIWEWTSKEH